MASSSETRTTLSLLLAIATYVQATPDPTADFNSHVVANGPVPECPNPPLSHYHNLDVCTSHRAVRRPEGHVERNSIYRRLRESGDGATLVPNQHTAVCPLALEELESPTAAKGLDTTWILENTSSKPVVVAWIVDGQEWSPFTPDIKPIDDPKAILAPGEWLNVPTFDSFVYHVRELQADSSPGPIVLQHRVGLIPIRNPNHIDCDSSTPDREPVSPETAERIPDFQRPPLPEVRHCNIIDLSFRNQVGCPLHVYWAKQLVDVPESGFVCGEEFRFHLGTKPATQDFMFDWESSTKFEGSFMGHTFVARLASDPSVVVDSYTVQPTRVIDCPIRQEEEGLKTGGLAEVVLQAEGTIEPQTLNAAAESGVPR